MIKVNGEVIENAEGMTITELLKLRDLPDRMIAIECNGMIVPRKTWEERTLCDGDHIEVVRFVGGG